MQNPAYNPYGGHLGVTPGQRIFGTTSGVLGVVVLGVALLGLILHLAMPLGTITLDCNDDQCPIKVSYDRSGDVRSLDSPDPDDEERFYAMDGDGELPQLQDFVQAKSNMVLTGFIIALVASLGLILFPLAPESTIHQRLAVMGFVAVVLAGAFIAQGAFTLITEVMRSSSSINDTYTQFEDPGDPSVSANLASLWISGLFGLGFIGVGFWQIIALLAGLGPAATSMNPDLFRRATLFGTTLFGICVAAMILGGSLPWATVDVQELEGEDWPVTYSGGEGYVEVAGKYIDAHERDFADDDDLAPLTEEIQDARNHIAQVQAYFLISAILAGVALALLGWGNFPAHLGLLAGGLVLLFMILATISNFLFMSDVSDFESNLDILLSQGGDASTTFELRTSNWGQLLVSVAGLAVGGVYLALVVIPATQSTVASYQQMQAQFAQGYGQQPLGPGGYGPPQTNPQNFGQQQTGPYKQQSGYSAAPYAGGPQGTFGQGGGRFAVGGAPAGGGKPCLNCGQICGPLDAQCTRCGAQFI